MEEEIRLRCDKTGRIGISEQNPESNRTKTIEFSTPDSDGQQFNTLFRDVKEGDELVLVFKTVRICRLCGTKLKKKKEE